jgi:hypothetical protein
MTKQKISISIELETASKLLARLSRERKNFSSKSELIQYAVKQILIHEDNSDAGKNSEQGDVA